MNDNQVRDTLHGKLWDFVRKVLDQGGAIQRDYIAGKYQTYEHLSARTDEAARERADQLEALLALSSHAPVWTTEKPMADGYYWHRTMLMNDRGFERGSIMVRVCGNNGVIEHGGQFSSYTLAGMVGEWSGPIEPPPDDIKGGDVEPPQEEY